MAVQEMNGRIRTAVMNGSPRKGKGASGSIVKEMMPYLEENMEVRQYFLAGDSLEECMEMSAAEGETGEDALEFLLSCDRILFVFPLYVDSPPATVTAALEGMEKIRDRFKNGKNLSVSAFVLAGLHEGRQTHVAIDIICNWTEKMGFSEGQMIGFGGSGALPAAKRMKPGEGLKEDLPRLYSIMAERTEKAEKGDRIYSTIAVSREDYWSFSEAGFRKLAKRNGLTEEDMGKQW